jgi:precorrin-3B synthase
LALAAQFIDQPIGVAARRGEMSRPAPRRKGWCPGALQPMETGDGLLARVRVSGGNLSLDQAAAIADCALQCGNGAIGLSARANLLIRGVGERTLPDLQTRLGAAGLLDADPEAERLRNIVVSPLSDIDPEAAFDLAPSVASLEARLALDSSLRPLPAKFSFVLDALGRLPVAEVDADIRFEAEPERGPASFAVFLGGDDGLAAHAAPGETGIVAARLARAFLTLNEGGGRAERRMRALVAGVGAAAVFAAAGLDTRPRLRSQRRTSLRQVLGGHAFGSASFVGATALFGEIDASRFKMMIERARAATASGVRLTPWRAFLIVGLEARRAASIAAASVDLGFVVSADEQRLRVAACPGAPACLHAWRPAREDATRWASLLPTGDGVVLHVSGCAKGCARPVPTAATLTATERGYDLVLAGKSGDRPVRSELSPEAIGALIAEKGADLFAAERPTE